MQDEVTKALEALSEMGMARRSGQHWFPGAAARRAPRRLIHPLAGVQLGIQSREEQAHIAALQFLECSPSANLPRLRPTDGSWAALCYSYPERANGMMGWLENYYTLGSLIQPDEWRRRAVVLDFNAFAGLGISVFVPGPNGSVDKAAMRGAQRRTMTGNDHRGIYLDRPVIPPDGVFELGISFS